MKKQFLLYFLLFYTFNFFAQSYQFTKYGLGDGLPQEYIYTINQDGNGFMWLGTGEGLSRFDGVTFKNFTVDDGLAENFITCSAQKEANTVWLGHNKGGISRIENGKIETVFIDTLDIGKITAMYIGANQFLWAVSQGGYIVKITSELEISQFQPFKEETNLYSISGNEGNLLVGTGEGVFHIRLDEQLNPKIEGEVKELKFKKIECIKNKKTAQNSFWVGTANEGLYELKFGKTGKILTRHFTDISMNDIGVLDVKEDEDDNLLLSTYSGLFKISTDKKSEGKATRYSTHSGISDYIKTSFVDREGNTWLGTYGEGLALLKDEMFMFYSYEDEGVPNDTRTFLFDNNVKWFGLSSGLLKISGEEEKREYFNEENGFSNLPVKALGKYKNEVFIGTDGNGLYRYDTIKKTFKRQYLITSYLANSVNDLLVDGDFLWVATEGGLIKWNINTNEKKVYNTLNGLRHNSVYDIKKMDDNSLAICSHSNDITYIKDGVFSYAKIAELDQLLDVVDLTVDENNNLWIATLGEGIFVQSADTFINVSTKNGLKSDYCYSIISGVKHGVWVGHRGGLTRVSTETLSAEIFDLKKGINDDFNNKAIYRDKTNNIWFGAERRVVRFNIDNFRKNRIPPIVNIKNIFVGDKEVPLKNNVELGYNQYKLQIDFIGINFKAPEGVKYQYFMEGYDLDWSAPSESRMVTYPRIDDGSYKFYVKACNNDGFCSEKTLGFELNIEPPFWKKWWFILAITISVFLLIYLVIVIREKEHKRKREQLEEALKKRTVELTQKGEELEEKNKNITDSINYALRIQKSILPQKKIMTDIYPESFALYKPRDIVSGDFYWFEKIGGKFIIACADCTGHGVPGAFMSMVASTLFKEIAYQDGITEPSEFLYKLDELLKATLNKTEENNVQDGLDLSLCVFDIETNKLSFSGAGRPIIIFSDGELNRYKTSPFSIGGDDMFVKDFTTKHYQLKEDDRVYMFSDGYPDQFGGVKGKKLYLKGFEKLLKDIQHLPMKEQEHRMDSFLEKWRGDNSQVDDVLVLGIKIL